ncbi:hypothetical protein [Nocardia sp. BMG51109]|uniref:hypothetical protein n=1 Tax=Nocardia sp. BMG51109 TaxID=1056816 RepID=UPI0012EC320B|nr:hypothetical protein [Nocardia sp. BMG51109]
MSTPSAFTVTVIRLSHAAALAVSSFRRCSSAAIACRRASTASSGVVATGLDPLSTMSNPPLAQGMPGGRARDAAGLSPYILSGRYRKRPPDVAGLEQPNDIDD